MNFPNLYIIGTYKSGTTALHRYLSEHPDVAEGRAKESHILDEFCYYDQDPRPDEWYNNFFPPDLISGGSTYLLDSTPSYFYGGEDLIKVVLRHEPNAKFLLVLRDPIERLISYYGHLASKGELTEDINDFLSECFAKYVPSGKLRLGPHENALLEGEYNKFLTPWNNLGRNRFAICKTEDLLASPEKVMSSIYRFLNITDISSQQIFRIENKTVSPRSQKLHDVITSPTTLSGLRQIMPRALFNIMRTGYRRFLTVKSENEISEHWEEKLRNLYKDCYSGADLNVLDIS